METKQMKRVVFENTVFTITLQESQIDPGKKYFFVGAEKSLKHINKYSKLFLTLDDAENYIKEYIEMVQQTRILKRNHLL